MLRNIFLARASQVAVKEGGGCHPLTLLDPFLRAGSLNVGEEAVLAGVVPVEVVVPVGYALWDAPAPGGSGGCPAPWWEEALRTPAPAQLSANDTLVLIKYIIRNKVCDYLAVGQREEASAMRPLGS